MTQEFGRERYVSVFAENEVDFEKQAQTHMDTAAHIYREIGADSWLTAARVLVEADDTVRS
jgi:hypothetical protein